MTETPIGKNGSEKDSNRSYGFVWLLILLVIGLAAYYFLMGLDPEIPEITATTLEKITPQTNKPLKQPEKAPFLDTVPSSFEAVDQPDDESVDEMYKPEFVLPELEQSDAFVKENAANLSNQSDFPDWLIPKQLIRHFTMLVDNVSRGELPRKSFRQYKPKKKFQAYRSGIKGHVMAEHSYRRYDPFVNMINSLDTEATAALYFKLQPLFQQAYEELGYPDQDFSNALFSAIEMVTTAPIIEGKIKLSRPSVMYKFAEKKLENLNEVHKQLIRMGPANTRKLQSKAREIVAAIRAGQQG